MRLWPWLVVSAAIHGLFFVFLGLYESPHSGVQVAKGPSRVTVELLGEMPGASVQVADESMMQHVDVKTKPMQRHKSAVQLIVPQAKGLLTQNRDIDTDIHTPDPKPVADAATTMNRQPSGQINSIVRKHLERFKYYPVSARRRGIEGEVDVAFTLAINGHTNEVSILHGSGYAILDRAALDTVQRAQPFPADAGHYRFRLRFSRL